MVGNGMSHYRDNYDNRNKMIWNNTHFRLFERDNPISLGIMQLEDVPFKANKDKLWLKGYEDKLPSDYPEIR